MLHMLMNRLSTFKINIHYVTMLTLLVQGWPRRCGHIVHPLHSSYISKLCTALWESTAQICLTVDLNLLIKSDLWLLISLHFLQKENWLSLYVTRCSVLLTEISMINWELNFLLYHWIEGHCWKVGLICLHTVNSPSL